MRAAASAAEKVLAAAQAKHEAETAALSAMDSGGGSSFGGAYLRCRPSLWPLSLKRRRGVASSPGGWSSLTVPGLHTVIRPVALALCDHSFTYVQMS